MSKGWRMFLLVVFALILGGAAFFSERWVNQLRTDYRVVVEENKALKKETMRPRLEIVGAILVKDSRILKNPIPLYAVRSGMIDYSKIEEVTLLENANDRSSNFLSVLHKWSDFGKPDFGKPEVVLPKNLPFFLAALSKKDLAIIDYVSYDREYNYSIHLKSGTMFSRANNLFYRFWYVPEGYLF